MKNSRKVYYINNLVLDREPRKVVALIKFRADAEQEAIAAGLKNVVDSAIAIAQEMD